MTSVLRIEFIPPSRPARWAWGVCGLLAFACAGSMAAAEWHWQQIEQVRDHIRTLEYQRRASHTALPPPTAAKAAAYDADARKMLNELAFPTKGALTALENVAVLGVTPTTIELQANTGVVRLQIEFSDDLSLLNYLSELNTGEQPPRWAIIQARAGGMSGKGTATLQSSW